MTDAKAAAPRSRAMAMLVGKGPAPAERVGFAAPPVLKTKEIVENTASRISTIAASAGV